MSIALTIFTGLALWASGYWIRGVVEDVRSDARAARAMRDAVQQYTGAEGWKRVVETDRVLRDFAQKRFERGERGN